MLSPPDITVVVCTHNGAATLAGTLRRLRAEVGLQAGAEIVVVDDGSTDATAEIAATEGARVVRLVPNAGLAAARNAGVSAARGAIVAFTDDDCEPEPGWIAALRDAFEAPEVEAVGGRVVPGHGENLVLRYIAAGNPLTPLPARLLVSNRLTYRLRLYLETVFGKDSEPLNGSELYSVVGANMAFRRQVIFDLGGFDEAFRFGGEEEDLCRRAHARDQGACIRYQPSAAVVHRFEASLRDTLRRSMAYGQGNARAALKHPDARLIVYPFPVVVALAALLGLLTRRRRLVNAGLFAPLGLYPRWLRRAARSRTLEPLLYGYLQLAQEWFTMLGEVKGWRAGYVAVASTHLERNGESGVPVALQSAPG